MRISMLMKTVQGEFGLHIRRKMMFRILRKTLGAEYGMAKIVIKDKFDPDSIESRGKRS